MMEHGETQKKMVHGLEWSVNCKKGQLILVSYLVFIKEIIPKYQVQTYLGMVPLSVTLERSKAITFSWPAFHSKLTWESISDRPE